MVFSPLILAIGDSLIAGYGLTSADNLPARIEQRLRIDRPDARVINAGMSGDMTGDVLRRLPMVMSRLNRRPDLAIVQAGANDVLRQVAPASMRANLAAILIELGRCGVPVLLTIVDPPAILRDRAAAYLGVHELLAAEHGATTCAFFPAGVPGHPAMVLADRIHPNAAAIALVADAMMPAIERALGRAAVAALVGRSSSRE